MHQTGLREQPPENKVQQRVRPLLFPLEKAKTKTPYTIAQERSETQQKPWKPERHLDNMEPTGRISTHEC